MGVAWVSSCQQSCESSCTGPGSRALLPFVVSSFYQGQRSSWTCVFLGILTQLSQCEGSECPLVAQDISKPKVQVGAALWRQELGLLPSQLAPDLGSAPQNSGLAPIPMHVSLSQVLCFSIFIYLHLVPSLSDPVLAHLSLCPY